MYQTEKYFLYLIISFSFVFFINCGQTPFSNDPLKRGGITYHDLTGDLIHQTASGEIKIPYSINYAYSKLMVNGLGFTRVDLIEYPDGYTGDEVAKFAEEGLKEAYDTYVINGNLKEPNQNKVEIHIGEIGIEDSYYNIDNNSIYQGINMRILDNGYGAYYSPYENEVKADIAHEFFHQIQASYGAFVSYNPNWFWVLDPMARFAPSAVFPFEFEDYTISGEDYDNDNSADSLFLVQVNDFLDKTGNDLALDSSWMGWNGTGYTYRYHSALYWRYLYEQHGTLQFIDDILLEIPETTDASHATFIDIMNKVLPKYGRFDSFIESLEDFAFANYALAYRNSISFNFDQEKLYSEPGLILFAEPYIIKSDNILPSGPSGDIDIIPEEISDNIPGRFGMDFIEFDFSVPGDLNSTNPDSGFRFKFTTEDSNAKFVVKVYGRNTETSLDYFLYKFEFDISTNNDNPEIIKYDDGGYLTALVIRLDTIPITAEEVGNNLTCKYDIRYWYEF